MFVIDDLKHTGIVVKREAKPKIPVVQEKTLPLFMKFSDKIPITGVYVLGLLH